MIENVFAGRQASGDSYGTAIFKFSYRSKEKTLKPTITAAQANEIGEILAVSISTNATSRTIGCVNSVAWFKPGLFGETDERYQGEILVDAKYTESGISHQYSSRHSGQNMEIYFYKPGALLEFNLDSSLTSNGTNVIWNDSSYNICILYAKA